MVLTAQYKSEYGVLKKALVDKDYLFVTAIFLLFLYSTLSLCFANTVPTIVQNAILILYVVNVVIYLLLKKYFNFGMGTLCLIGIILIIFLINLACGVMALSPLVNLACMLFAYMFAKSLKSGERSLILRTQHVSLLILLLLAYIRYLPTWLETGTIPVADSHFMNMDGLTDCFSILLMICLYYVRKKSYQSIIPAALSLFFILLSERRTAVLLCLVAVLIFIFSFFPRGKRHYFVLIAAAIVFASALLILTIPAFESLAQRFIVSITTLFNYEGAYAGEERLAIALRGLYYSFTNMFGAFGYDIWTLHYGGIPPHDLLGDLSFNYGGLFAFVCAIYFSISAFRMVARRNEYSLVTIFIGISFFVFFFLGTFVYNRYLCLFAGCSAGFAFSRSMVPVKKFKQIL